MAIDFHWKIALLRCYAIHISSCSVYTFNIGAPSASSILESVSIVKLCVPRIHLLISASDFPSIIARSFCL